MISTLIGVQGEYAHRELILSVDGNIGHEQTRATRVRLH